MREILVIAAGGAIGATARYLTGVGARRAFGDGFPWGTLAVNLAGCFSIGLAIEFGMARRDIAPHWHRGFTVGFLGALTTFSTFGVETVRHLEKGEWTMAFANIAANMLVGLAAVWLGLIAGRTAFDLPMVE